MSVATSTRYFPRLNPASASVRCDCDRFPWIRSALKPRLTRKRWSRLARCLVRVKTSASFMSPRSSSVASSDDLSSCDTGYTAWVMPTAGAAGRLTFSVAGRRSISWASAAIGGGIVALKSIVWRLAGRCRSTRLMSGRNPMSSIRSASSSTRCSSPASFA